MYHQWHVVPWVLPELQSVSAACPEAGRPRWQNRQPSRHTQSELLLSDCHMQSTCGPLQSETQSWQTTKRTNKWVNLTEEMCNEDNFVCSLWQNILQVLPAQLQSRWREVVLGCGPSRKQWAPPLNICSEKLEIIPSTSLPASVKTLAQSAAVGGEKS